MRWQDAVFTLGSICFALALIPSIRSKEKPALMTSVMTGLWLLVFSIVYVSLDLWFSALTTAITGGMWLTLAIQKVRSESNS